MAQKYYNSAETAKILGKSVDEVKEMLQSRELHGYRDGADWMFKAEDIDKLAGKSAPSATGEEGGDVLLSDAELGQSDPGLSGTVIGMNGGGQVVPDSDIRLAESDIEIADQSKAPAKKPKAGSDSKFEELDLTLEEDLTLEDSTLMLEGKPAPGGDSSFVDLGDSKTLEDDNLVLGGSGKGSDLTLGGDSGISLVDPSDSGFSLETPVNLGTSEESLELGEEDMLATGEPVSPDSAAMLKTDDEFMLTPLEEVTDAEGSESGSQVIALDTEGDEEATMVGAGAAGASMAAMLDEDLSSQPALDLGASAPLGGASVLGAQPGTTAEGAALMQTSAYSFEPPYTGWQIAGLAVCVVLLMLCGMMMFDVLRNMWSWNEAFTVNSSLMDTILGWIGI
ncbi:MAG: helix-turn-helix domain-containing protein [Pirellulales bacterium]|nr:helix-turn-helix domain-containing protein [Pirellulales bacterium]